MIAVNVAVAGSIDGVGENATFNGTVGIAIYKDGGDTIYLTDRGSNKIRKLYCESGFFKYGVCRSSNTVYSSGSTSLVSLVSTYYQKRLEFSFSSIFGIVSSKIDSLTYYISCGACNLLYTFYFSSEFPSVSSVSTTASFSNPTFVDSDSSGNFYVVDDAAIYVLYYSDAFGSYDQLLTGSYTGLAVIESSAQYNIVLFTIAKDTGSVLKVYYTDSGFTYDTISTSLSALSPYSLVLNNAESSVYVACGDYTIRQVDIESGVSVLYAGVSYISVNNDASITSSSNPATFTGAEMILAIDKNDNIYLSSKGSSLRVISYLEQTVYTVAGDPSKLKIL